MIWPRATAFCGLAGMTAGLKVLTRPRALLVHRPVTGHHPRWPVRPEPYPRGATAVAPTLVARGPPTLDWWRRPATETEASCSPSPGRWRTVKAQRDPSW